MEKEWSHKGRILRKSLAVTLSIRVCHSDGCDLHPVGKEERRAQNKILCRPRKVTSWEHKLEEFGSIWIWIWETQHAGHGSLPPKIRLEAWTNAAVWRVMDTECTVTLGKQHWVTESVWRTWERRWSPWLRLGWQGISVERPLKMRRTDRPLRQAVTHIGRLLNLWSYSLERRGFATKWPDFPLYFPNCLLGCWYVCSFASSTLGFLFCKVGVTLTCRLLRRGESDRSTLISGHKASSSSKSRLLLPRCLQVHSKPERPAERLKTRTSQSREWKRTELARRVSL